MSKKQWVCHISGQGEKWEVANDYSHTWEVLSKVSRATYNFPKSEYRLCDPPEVWEKVEVGIRGWQSTFLYLKDAPHLLNFARLGEGFRWVKSGDGVIVERRKS